MSTDSSSRNDPDLLLILLLIQTNTKGRNEGQVDVRRHSHKILFDHESDVKSDVDTLWHPFSQNLPSAYQRTSLEH